MRGSLRTFASVLGEFAVVATLLFVVRFILRVHLVPYVDEECTLGGVAVDLLAHGVRFRLPVYAPNDYENGFFYSGLLTAASFSALGRNVLALKMPTHLIGSMGAAASLWLLRSCLDELRLTARAVRWTAIAVLIVATLFSPRAIAFYSTCAVGIGSHIEGPAIDMALLALFVRRRAAWSTIGTAAFWALMGFALHVNKGAILLVLVLAIAELSRARSSPRVLAAAGVGFLLGGAPALLTTGSANSGGGWESLTAKLLVRARDFPFAFTSTVATVADDRPELLATWVLAIALALSLALRRRSSSNEGTSHPSAIRLTVGLLVLHVAALTVMAQGGIDYYAMHAYPPLVVVTALFAGSVCSAASREWGVRGGRWAGALIVGAMIVVHRPDTLSPGFSRLSALWNDREGAACSWRFAEAFLRLQGNVMYDHVPNASTAPEGDGPSLQTREQRAIALCRTLSEEPQILDCIGGVARDLEYGGGKIDGEPPPSLRDTERRAFAFYYGVRRYGALTSCDDFREPALRDECRTAVQLDCFNLVDMSTRYVSGNPLGRPHCDVPPPPMDGYYARMRSDLLSRPWGSGPKYSAIFSEQSMGTCKTLVGSCY